MFLVSKRWSRSFRLKKLYPELLLLFLKRLFLKYKVLYFVQCNQIYRFNENNDIMFSPKVKYRFEKNSYDDKILVLCFYKTSSFEIDDKIVNSIVCLPSLFNCKLQSFQNKRTYFECKLIYKEKEQRLNHFLGSGNKLLSNISFVLDKYSNWNIEKHCHFLISGNTGSGKSMFLYYLIDHLRKLTNDDNIYILDGKNSELFEVSKEYFDLKNVYGDFNDIISAIKKVNEYMEKSYKNKVKNSLPVFLVIDEYTSLRLVIEKKKFEEMEKNIKNIILKGRAAKIHIILSLQRASSNNLDLDIRDNTDIKVGLGNLSSENFKMIFGFSKNDLELMNRDVGQGYILLNGEDLKEFEVPFIHMDT